METEKNYFAYCLETNTKINYFIVPSKFLKPRPNARHSNPGLAWDSLGQDFWGAVLQSAWHWSLEVDPDDGSFLDQEPKDDKDFEHLLSEAEYKDCLVLATASSVQELQHFVQSCNIKVPKKYKRLDESVASGSQQQDKPEQEKKPFRSSESNQQESSKDNSMFSQSLELKSVSARASPSDTPPEDTQIEMEEPIESHDDRGAAHIRPQGKANLGFFESEIDERVVTRQNADNVCVLVIHYEFKNNPDYFRKGDACDVERLNSIFGKNRNCNFRNFRSPNKKTLLKLLGDQEKLLQFFSSQDDVPSVFVLFILSHGTENGTILTDHLKRNSDEYECFTTDEILDSLQKLKRFDKCLKIVNFGPCRGSLEDSKYDTRNSYKNYENRNACRITNRAGMQNYVMFYSTVETTMANTDEKGSWFVRNICMCLNNADDEPLLKFFTIVQNRMHHSSRSLMNFAKNTPLGQTPELKMFTQDRKFVISKANITEKPISNTDASSGKSKVLNELHSGYFAWKSDEGQDIRGRRGFILSVTHCKQVQDMKRVLQNLDFEITDWTLSSASMNFYFKIVSELEPDVGCILTCIFGPVCENEHNEVCVRVQKGQEIPITDILHSLVGPKNDKFIGKPKLLFVVNVEAPQTDSISLHTKNLQVSATNHSGWLILILKYDDALQKFNEKLEKIGEKSLQELLENLITCESNREDVVLLNSTLQYLIKFPNWPRAFVKPHLKIKMKKIPREQIYKNSSEPLIEEKIDFDTLTKEAKRLFEENKKSIESLLQTMSLQEKLQIPSEIEPSKKLNLVKDLEAVSTVRNSAEASILWLFNSVAGAGKSTVLKEMARQLTKHDGGFKVLLIPLKKYYRYLLNMPASKVNEIEFLANTTCNSNDDIKNWIEKRETIVFLDGFDEVCPDFREKIIKILIALNQARVPLIIGTRPHEVHHIQDRIQKSMIVEIEPLDEAKQIEFLEKVARKSPQEIAQLRKIFKDQDILGNPLYLSLLAEYSGDGNLYDIFDKIVRHKVKICLVRENGGKDVGEEMIDKELKFIQLVASRFVRGVKIDQGSVTKEALEKMNAFGVVTHCNDRVNFTHQTFAEFLTSQKFIEDLKNPVDEEVPLFNEELVQCRKFVDLFLSTEKGKDASYTDAFADWAISNPLKLVKLICRENLRQMFNLLNPDLSLKDEDGKNALHFALRHLEMVKMVHERNSRLATETTNDGENCLHLAIIDEECSEEVAIWLLKNTDVDKNAETIFEHTPLLLAGETDKWEVAQHLIFADDEAIKTVKTGVSILPYFILGNKLDLVKALIDRGSDVNFKNDDGRTALHLAARWNENPEIADILLESGAKENAQDNCKWTALHFAAKYNKTPGIVLKLLENGADVDIQDDVGCTALHLAARWNKNPQILNTLLEKCSKVNAQDRDKMTALHTAVETNPNVEVIQTLLENGADVHLQNIYGSTALHLAARNRNPEIVKIFLQKGAKVNAQDNKKQTALHYTVDSFDPATAVVRELLENGADLDLQDKDGFTALHLAAMSNENPEMVKILLDKGAKVNATNKDKCTVLHYAARHYPVSEIIQKMLENGADIHLQNSDGNTVLHLAAGFNRNPEIVKILLEKGAKVNVQNHNKWTALHYAARYSSSREVFQKLLENGADVDSQTKGRKSALHLAAEWTENPELVQILLENGAKVNVQNNDNWTALHFAARYNPDSKIIQMLLANGADVHSKNKDGYTALYLAAGWNTNPEIVKNMLENGAKVNAQNNDKCTALHLAAEKNSNAEVIQILLENGADVQSQNIYGNTALHQTAGLNRNPEIVKILLEKGAKVNVQNHNKWTALHYTVDSFDPATAVVQELLENGIDVDLQDKDGFTALHLAARRNKNSIIVKMLLENGAKINAESNDKCTALHLAARYNPAGEIVQKLLENGADVDSLNQQGESALHLAAWYNTSPEIVNLLLEQGAEVNAQDNYKWTALHFAARFNPASEIVQTLIENGSDVDSHTSGGKAALHLAAQHNINPEIVKILLENGSDVNAQENDGWTALHFAVRFNQAPEIVQMLIQHGADVRLQNKDGYTAFYLAAGYNTNPEIVKIILENGANLNAGDNGEWTALLHYAATHNRRPEVVQMLLDKGALINEKNSKGETALFLAAKHNCEEKVVQILLDNGAAVNKKILNDKECAAVLRQMKINGEILKKLTKNDRKDCCLI